MRKYNLIFILLTIVLLFASCSKDGVEPAPMVVDEDECILNVKFDGFTLTESQSAKPVVRGGSDITEVNTVVNRLAVALYSSDQLIKEVKQYSTDDDYGTVSFIVPPGDYKIVAVAYYDKGSSEIPSFTNMSKYVLPFNEKPNDTFYGAKDIIVNGGGEEILVNMSRAVAGFQLTSYNSVPNEVTKMQIIFSKGSKNDLNPTTGLSLTDEGYTWEATVSSVKRSENPVSWTAYILLAEDEENVDITVNALNELSEIVNTRQFTNVTLKRNRKLTATGTFFSHNNTSGFVLDTDWLEGESITY